MTAPRRRYLLLSLLCCCADPKLDPDQPLPPAFSSAPRLFRPKRSIKPYRSPRPVLSSTPGEMCSPLSPPEPEVVLLPESKDVDDDEEAPQGAPACPEGMVEIKGDYCMTVHQDCLEWMDAELPLDKRKRCAKFAPTKCLGEKKRLRFCIDRLEANKSPDSLPINDLSWTMAREQCHAQGKRLCYEHEWTFACEGEEMRPYPYGHERNAALCNHDRMDLLERGKMKDNRHKASDHPDCKSPFGVVNMVGNVDEWVQLDAGYPPMRSGLKGGWWLAGRNRCRPTTGGHDEYYHDTQTGYRCCKDAGAPAPAAGK